MAEAAKAPPSRPRGAPGFKRRFLLAVMLSGAAFTGLFNIAALTGLNPLTPIHIVNNTLHIVAALTMALILWLRAGLFLPVAWGHAANSLLIFLSALYFMPTDEMRFLWFFLEVGGTFLLLGTRAGWGMCLVVIAIVTLSDANGWAELSQNGLSTFAFGLLTAAAFFHAYNHQEQRHLDEIAAANASLDVAASHDALTGLTNLRAFREYADAALAEARQSREPLSLLFLDVDRFKSINDRFGHAGGDLVLKSVADTLRVVVRASDLPARIGGEEFVILLSDTDGIGAAQAGERLRAMIEASRPVIGDDRLAVTASIGWATSGGADATLDQLLKRADAAMYRAKEAGRNRVEGSEGAPSAVTSPTADRFGAGATEAQGAVQLMRTAT